MPPFKNRFLGQTTDFWPKITVLTNFDHFSNFSDHLFAPKKSFLAKNEVGKKDSLITFMVYNITVQKWIDELHHQLEKCKSSI